MCGIKSLQGKKKPNNKLYPEHFLCKCSNITGLLNDVTCKSKSLCEIMLAETNQV